MVKKHPLSLQKTLFSLEHTCNVSSPVEQRPAFVVILDRAVRVSAAPIEQARWSY